MNHKPKYDPQIHHRRSTRLKGYDYSQQGLYFVTICTYERECLFGEIIDKKMILNDFGKMADECWLKIPEHFPNALLHDYIVMPNHVHGIIELANADDNTGQTVGVQNNGGIQNNVGVQNFEPLPAPSQNFGTLPPQLPRNRYQHIIPRSIGSIVRGYKVGVTNFFRDNTDINDVWQRNFHDHIIRDEQSYWRISEYIIHNPDLWEEDKFYRADTRRNEGNGSGSKF